MNTRVWLLSAAVVAAVVAPAASAGQEETMRPSDYVVVPHIKGSLALQVSSITALWYQPASEGKGSQLRVLSPALSDAKTLTDADADRLWAVFRERDEDYLFVSHMGGTLAIPRDQIRTAYYAVDNGTARLRLMYDGDLNGKTLDGEEATRVWQELRR